ncbi:MAG: alpha-amylase [Lachnospiraceae bacterium]|nr:alpha-amylase [Lachnospiraceae bacterium]
MEQNGLMMQYFEWYLPEDASLWKTVKANASKLKTMGVSAVWLPPAYKGAKGIQDVGYGAYDLYDLGEFDQKGTVPTKYGTKDEYLDAIQTLQAKGIEVYADIVLNHKMGADEAEEITAEEFNACNRNQMIGDKKVILGWTKFTFPGRKGKYSKFTWNWNHFDGIDWDQEACKSAIYKFVGKNFDTDVDDENGNYDYLMGSDVDFDNPEVSQELYRWGQWYLDTTGVSGMRLDAVKHIGSSFYRKWLPAMREITGKELFTVGEYWHWDVRHLESYLEKVEYNMSLFDVPLHLHFHDASKAHGSYDLRTIFDNTLVQRCPMQAVTFVENHDSQPGQSLESWVEDWFKPMAYALIMLRASGYPCLFYGDYAGIPHDNIPAMKSVLDRLLKLRKKYAYGPQHDYLDNPNVIGWTREGDEAHKGSGCAVILSDGTGGTKRMYIGKRFAGMHFVDEMKNAKYNIKIDEEGFGDFYVNRAAVAVWIQKEPKPRKTS